MINFITAGESHGRGIVVIIEGVPAGLKLSEERINKELSRRRKGYGRGKRMSIEQDSVEIISGVRFGETIGSPICAVVFNKDFRRDEKQKDKLLNPRPGHADLTGAMKFLRKDLRDILERASARETVGRVIAGSVSKQLLEELGIFVGSFVIKVWKVEIEVDYLSSKDKLLGYHKLAEESLLRIPVVSKEKQIINLIDKAFEKKDTLGGEFVVFATGVPVGLGSYTQWNQRFDAKVAFSMMSIPAVKSVEIGLGKGYSERFGSEVHDKIYYDNKSLRFYRDTNNAGGIEGGITNGEPVVARCVMKPIPTLGKPLKSVNIQTKLSSVADVVRSDVIAVPACSVIAESMLAVTIASELKLKFGGDSMKELVLNYKNYIQLMRKF